MQGVCKPEKMLIYAISTGIDFSPMRRNSPFHDNSISLLARQGSFGDRIGRPRLMQTFSTGS